MAIFKKPGEPSDPKKLIRLRELPPKSGKAAREITVQIKQVGRMLVTETSYMGIVAFREQTNVEIVSKDDPISQMIDAFREHLSRPEVVKAMLDCKDKQDAPKSWYSRIKSGDVKACPACGSRLEKDDTFTMYDCVNPGCCWNDESADLADMGRFAPPKDWRTE